MFCSLSCFKNSTILFLDTRTEADAESMFPVLSFVKGVCASTEWILCKESWELSELERHVLAWIICRFLCDSMCDVTRSFSVCLSMALRDQSSNLCLYLSVRTLSASGERPLQSCLFTFLLVVWGSAAIHNTSHDHVYSSLQTCITLMHIYELINVGGLIWDDQTVTWNMFHITRW